MQAYPEAVVIRLCEYRLHLSPWIEEGRERIFSHELAALSGASPAQVRRDLMTIGFTGSPARGYDSQALLQFIVELLSPGAEQSMTLVGVGHLGRALLAYFERRRPDVPIPYAFDIDSDIIGAKIGETEIRDVGDLEDLLEATPPVLAILAVRREQAQPMADRLTEIGVGGILNFAPTRIQARDGVHVEHIDITTTVDKALFFSRMMGEAII